MGEREALTVRMAPALAAVIRTYAAERGITRSAAIVILLERGITATSGEAKK